MTRKFTFEYVYNYFKEHNCKLLEKEYINNKTKMNYICKCGNLSSIRFDDFKNSNNRCKKCSGLELFTYEYFFNYFKENNCKLLDKKYINAQTLMNYKCKCENLSSIRFDDFKNRKSRCIKCSGKEKHNYKYVYDYFKSKGCILISKVYINTSSKLQYICSCGELSEITFNSFKNSNSRCINCSYERVKISYLFKNYKMPSGNNIRIQGYEHIALDELVKKYQELDIITERKKVPTIKYTFKNKQLRYYPDIYIVSENKIIEVKSTWTYNINLIKNIHKALAVRKLGYDFEFWIYDQHKFKIII